MDYSILVQNIAKLANEKGISKTKALIESGVGKDFTNDIERRNISPSINKIQKIAAYFNVSTDYLLGNEQKEKSSPQLSDEDLKVFEAFKALGVEQQKLVRSMIENLKKK